MRTIFVKLSDGSLTEINLKLNISKEFGGCVEHRFYRTVCRMRINNNGILCDEFIGIYSEIPNDDSSTRFIEYVTNNCSIVEKRDIVGLLHPSEWRQRTKKESANDLEALSKISIEYDLPIIPLRKIKP